MVRRYSNILIAICSSFFILFLSSLIRANDNLNIELIGINENRFVVVDEASVDIIKSGQLRNVSGIYTFTGESGLITESYLDESSKIHLSYYYLIEPIHDMVAGYGSEPLPVKVKFIIKEVSLYGYACLVSMKNFEINDSLTSDIYRIKKEVLEPKINEIWSDISMVNLSEISIKRYQSLMEKYKLPNDGYNKITCWTLFAYVPDENIILFEGEGPCLPPIDDPRVMRKLMLYPVYNYKEGKLIKIIYTIKGEFIE
ncbi:MAG: hypothetical protein ACUVWP_09210 [bacterium]